VAAGILLICILAIALFYPLAAPWRKPSLYAWLVLWFGAWLTFFYLSHLGSVRYGSAQNSSFVGLFIFSLATGSLVRVTSRGIAAWVRRRRGQLLNPPPGRP